MSRFLNILIDSLIMVASLLYVWNRLLNTKINFKSRKTYISFFMLSLITAFNYYLVNNFIKIFLITVVFMIFFKYLFNQTLKRCIITPIFYQLIIMISEGILAFVLAVVLRLDTEQIKNMFLGTLLINIGTAITSALIVSIPWVRKAYARIIKNIDKTNEKTLVVMSMIFMGFANVFAMFTYYKSDSTVLVMVNIFFTLFCCFIVYYSFEMKNNYDRVNDKYNITINSLKDYEVMMAKNRIDNHENKNMLLTIRAMILNNEKDVPKYIDTIVKSKYNDNENLLKQISIIPSGGLRATIYSEILKIQSHNIKYNLNIDSKVSFKDLIELDTNTTIDVCKIIGVLIDNAIDEVCKLKEKNIGISIFLEKNLLKIKISNNYKTNIDLSKIYQEGYTTKGNGHGYGLPLVKSIINNNDKLSNEIELNSKLFSQIICIKIKKKA